METGFRRSIGLPATGTKRNIIAGNTPWAGDPDAFKNGVNGLIRLSKPTALGGRKRYCIVDDDCRKAWLAIELALSPSRN